MDVYKELTFGKGYSIIPIENMKIFKKIRESFIQRININFNKKNDINFLRREIATMSKAQINKCMINLLKFNDLSELIINSFPKLIKKLCGRELFIQRRATIIMNLPGDGQAKQWTHYEMMSGISPFTYIIWAPFHDLEDSSGVYYIDQQQSLKIMKKEQSEGLVNGPTVLNMMQDQKPIPLKFGQAIIFNPFVLHGSVKFYSEYARIACNVRFQSCSKPLLQKNTDYLRYYKIS